MTEYETIITQIVSNEPSMLYTIVIDDDAEIHYSDEDQWYSNIKYDYTQSGTFLDMGSGSPIDDLVESSTLMLLDWNDSMTDIQLFIRFVDKVQAISVVWKWSISVDRDTEL
ncbi:hypothetical protein M9H77_08750 [Catharanthus roseus]|uniref:Uncharacterized protein n=1 Tax=Catharanthus roseus TaxID=4058 RepID=A0ACC0BYS1_CATRO|nr:hypothetical protein M9H77_08750 [Catharanthus roseus]